MNKRGAIWEFYWLSALFCWFCGCWDLSSLKVSGADSHRAGGGRDFNNHLADKGRVQAILVYDNLY